MEVVVPPEKRNPFRIPSFEGDYVFETLERILVTVAFSSIRVEVVSQEYEIAVGVSFDSITPEGPPVDIGDDYKFSIVHDYSV